MKNNGKNNLENMSGYMKKISFEIFKVLNILYNFHLQLIKYYYNKIKVNFTKHFL